MLSFTERGEAPWNWEGAREGMSYREPPEGH